MNKIAIFASGSGTNAENIIKYFKGHQNIKIDLIISNKKDAYVNTRAQNHCIDNYLISRELFYNSTELLDILQGRDIKYLILAGFLWLIPDYLIKAYPNGIINIHPALLPKYGGKGMYGMRVHRAVAENGDKQTGITIHFCNEAYDEGAIIFQQQCNVSPEDTPDDIANKVHSLEYQYFPKIIEEVILNKT